MTAVLLAVAILGPLAGSLGAILRPGVARSGRSAVVGGAMAAAAAAILLVQAGLNESGTVGGTGWSELSASRVSALLLLVVTGTATVVSGFSARSLDDDGRPAQYFGLIGLLVSGSGLVVLPGLPVLLLVGWVASGWALVGLVGFESDWSQAKSARKRIAATLAVGDIALIVAVLLATANSDGLLSGNGPEATSRLQEGEIFGVATVHLVAMLVVVAGASRSAMVPFHRWLIGTLAAPTPVSALVHAGLVSGAGLVLIRFAGPFVASDPAVVVAFVLGVVTVAVASTASALRSDVKGGLAWSTVAQMAFMVIQCSVGAFSSAVFHIAGHGMYKAALFLGAGDTASAGLRAARRPVPEPRAGRVVRLLVAVFAPLVAVGTVALIIPPAVSDGGRVLVVLFAWITIGYGLWGWLARGPFGPLPSVVVGVAASVVSAVVYLGGLRLAEEFFKPSLGSGSAGTIIGPTTLLVVAAVVVAVIVTAVAAPGELAAQLNRRWFQLVTAATVTGSVRSGVGQRLGTVDRTEITDPVSPPPRRVSSIRQRAEIRADVALANTIIAPQWPLASFVAVNPLGGVEAGGFDAAAAAGRRWLGGRTHLSLVEFRDGHRNHATDREDLLGAVHGRYGETVAAIPPLVSDTGNGVEVTAADVIVADLLEGPETPAAPKPPTALQRSDLAGTDELTTLINKTVSTWLAWYLEPPKWKPFGHRQGFVPMSRWLLAEDPAIGRLRCRRTTAWLSGVEADPAAMIDSALAVLAVEDDDRVDEIRSQLCELPGWAGLAKWRNEWAQPNEMRPALAPIELVAVRVTLEAMALISHHGLTAAPVGDDGSADRMLLEDRVNAVCNTLGLAGDPGRRYVSDVLSLVPADDRPSTWLAAMERRHDRDLLGRIERSGGSSDRGDRVSVPEAQLVFCIDVRSEGLRRQLESLGSVETIGFAGFFGVPMRVRRLGWDHTEARCPVLVAPAIEASERPRTTAVGTVARVMSRERTKAGIGAAHTAAKFGPGAPFTLAETAGWFTGPAAALRTFRPGTAALPSSPETTMVLDDDEVLLEQRVYFAEGVLKTMGLTSGFAPVVMLCGHTSRTVNNPHATALECGACAGASGEDNARAVAALLNSADVRHGLSGRGIDIPDETWFMAGLHDTASDHVQFLDLADVPSTHQPDVAALRKLFKDAGRLQATARAQLLPGPVTNVRDRGADWAQVRPEWGLAGNAAFVIGPRTITADLDLRSRAFLHNYDRETDPTGRVLETIMTAPLVVGHWISAQYYFSTVDPEVFGAGNKLLHNPVGTTGVFSGEGGDLRVGLPLQSTHVDGRRFHQPLRLLAVIQAERSRIDAIIAATPILQSLTGGSWLRIAARSGPEDRWHHRAPDGTWVLSPGPIQGKQQIEPTLTTKREST